MTPPATVESTGHHGVQFALRHVLDVGLDQQGLRLSDEDVGRGREALGPAGAHGDSSPSDDLHDPLEDPQRYSTLVRLLKTMVGRIQKAKVFAGGEMPFPVPT